MNRLFSSFFALATLSWLGLATAAGTPAGTLITNQAAVSADPVQPGQPPIVALSNVVSASVSPVCSVSVTPDGTPDAPGQSAVILPQESATFTYRLTNTGNTDNSYSLRALVEAASAFTPGSLNIFLDANGNGLLDGTEAAAPLSTLKLAPDAAATLFLSASSGPSDRGNAFVNLSAACPGGAPDDSNNVSQLQVGQPPVVTLAKTFTPALVKPGDIATVRIVAKNSGQGASRTLVLGDVLNALAAQGLSYVGGSASALLSGTATGSTPVAPEYSADLGSYSAAEPTVVSGLRVTVASLAPAQSLTLSFQMKAGASAENKTLTNTAMATSSNLSVSGSALLEVRYTPAVAIGPLGDPEAAEGSSADSQTVPFAVVGQPVCFDHTLKNTGNVTDNFKLSLSYPKGQATANFLNLDGSALVQPLTLEPGQSVPLRVCYLPQEGSAALQALLSATGDRGETNATRDLVTSVEAGLPILTKSTGTSGTVKIGDSVSYTLAVKNPYTHALTAAQVSDVLSSAHTFVSASDGGSYDAPSRAVTWKLGTLQPGETRTLTLGTVVSAAAVDGQNLVNTFSLTTAEVPQPVLSNQVKTPVWSAALIISKVVNTVNATYGDRLTYTLTIRNTSLTTDLTGAVITDTLPSGLVYISGTSTLAGTPMVDPGVSGQVLTWTALTIPANAQIVVTYAVRVTPEATGTMVNTVVVAGKGNNATAISSNTATATVKAKPLNFAALGDLVGYVYLDRNRDGNYDPVKDLPMVRARVILAGGRSALTDNEGRYHFSDVPYGTQALRLDPASVPYAPETRSYDGGLSGTQTVQVLGLTSVDFPLAPVSGDVQVLRRTVLTMGDLKIQKTVYVSGQEYTVQLMLDTPAALNEFVLDDPLPPGAVVLGTRPALSATLPAGTTAQTYRFSWDGEPRAAVTDPSASWRY
ncbi:DUF11 domain-containing protein [Deinococcus sp.]|uniref:DUF11 domain-containing protein n=1 Tax=Deinococcus sp. TaxID=47478 RepID=UPI003CC522CF